MSDRSGIEWTDATWNPTRGCTRVSPGCERCYAERVAHRNSHYLGLTTAGSRWTGEVRLVLDALDQPLRWRKPRRIFVDSMSDLFHEAVPDEFIDRVFAVMALLPQHTFQILTKRAERMREYVSEPGRATTVIAEAHSIAFDCDTTKGRRLPASVKRTDGAYTDKRPWYRLQSAQWPLSNVWLGVSVEDQQRADERIPSLLSTPAAVRFLSLEPLLEPVDLRPFGFYVPGVEARRRGEGPRRCIDWVIVGGESGPGARPCDVAWIRSLVEQCKAASVPCFVKQLGARPYLPVEHDENGDDLSLMFGGAPVDRDDGDESWWPRLRDRKGSDPQEWPEDLRVRQMPRVDEPMRRAEVAR